MPSAGSFHIAGSAVGSTTRIDRLRDAGRRAERAERLAQQLVTVCTEAESTLSAAVQARHDQQLSWLVLCDRGWPSDQAVTDFDIVLVQHWLSAWSEMVALPLRIQSPRDLVRIRRIRQRLDRCESALRPSLPPSVWQVVGALDDTGRSTLACVLQALDGWVQASARCDRSARQKERLAVWLSLFTHQARSLGLTVPVAALDLDGWRAVAAAARTLADEVRQISAA